MTLVLGGQLLHCIETTLIEKISIFYSTMSGTTLLKMMLLMTAKVRGVWTDVLMVGNLVDAKVENSESYLVDYSVASMVVH